MPSVASKTRSRKLSTINGRRLHDARPPQLAASLFLSEPQVRYRLLGQSLQFGPIYRLVAHGTKRTWRGVRSESAFGAKAEVGFRGRQVSFRRVGPGNFTPSLSQIPDVHLSIH